jgi:hypothetical protein
MTIEKQFNIIQDELNWLSVKARLLNKWVDRKILNRIILEYEDKVHKIIYPLIKAN